MKKTAQQPVVVLIYDQAKASSTYDHLKTIQSRPVRTLDKTGSFDVEFRFSLKDLFADSSSSVRTIVKPTVDVVTDQDKLRALTPKGNIKSMGYVTELRCVGRYNDSPVSLLFGAPDITRASFTIVEQLSEGKSLPESVARKLASPEPMLTTLCPPVNDFPSGGALAEAVSIGRSRDGLLLFSSMDDGGIMAQNPKAMFIIDECAGVSERSLTNTYVASSGKAKEPMVQTPGTSLISSMVRCYPSSMVRLVWDDRGDKDSFKVDADVMFSIPHKVVKCIIEEISLRKQIVSKLRGSIGSIRFAIQASTMHGDWEYDEETDTYVNRDDGKRYDANKEYVFCARIAISMRYNDTYPEECAIARDHQFYPMPVWPSSGVVNGVPRSGVKPYPSTLYEQVSAGMNVIAGESGRKRRAAAEACLDGTDSGAASSSAVDDD